MRIWIAELHHSDAALTKLGSRGISIDEARQLLGNSYETRRNSRDRGGMGKRIFLVGRTNGGRALTVVLERTIDSAIWQIITAWEN
jgi:uncharacterized DUF497 family protein